jgi:hypothetical protein
MTKRKSQSIEKPAVEQSVIATKSSTESPIDNHLWGIGTLSDDNTFNWYLDTTGVVFHTGDIRVAKLQCDEINRRYGSSRTVYVVREIR